MNSVLNTVYNNYMSTYTPKSLTRYDTHKKSELRSVYNSIVKLNKESPWYLPTTNKETQNYAVSLKAGARELHNTIAQLGGLEQDGMLEQKTAYSSDENIATAQFLGTGSDSKLPEGFRIEVRTLASPQENMGVFLPDEAVTLKPDTYSFDVGINDLNYEFQFTISEGDTNKDVQSRLMRLINSSNIGIHANLSESEGKTALVLSSDSSGLPLGRSEIFRVSDDHTGKTAGTVAYFGLDYTSRKASNANFLLNGEERTASSNHFTVGKAFELTLQGVSEEGTETQIGLKTNIDSMADNILSLVGSYNSFLQTVSAYTQVQSGNDTLTRELKGISNVFVNEMESTGLNHEEDGTLTLNKDTLKQAIQQSDDLKDTFSYLKDFSNALMRKSNQVSINPMEYVNKTVVAYKNPGHNFVSPYTQSAYSGMMFNSYC